MDCLLGKKKHSHQIFIVNVTARVHGNTNKTPTHALSVTNIKRIVDFLENYAEVHAILLLGRTPGVKDYGKVKLIPSSVTKKEVYMEYIKAVESIGERGCARRTFQTYWRKYVPDIKIMKGMTDLCWVCQKNSSTISRSANMPIERQTEVS